MSFSPPGLITGGNDLEPFDCGRESLNQYLKKFALTNTAAGIARTYVTTVAQEASVIAYYSLAAGSVERADVPERIGKGVPNYPVPVVVLARLAVDLRFQSQGVGKGLLRDALQRASSAAVIIGVRAILVHAKDHEAATFYMKFGFAPSPADSLHLMLLLKDLRRTLTIR